MVAKHLAPAAGASAAAALRTRSPAAAHMRPVEHIYTAWGAAPCRAAAILTNHFSGLLARGPHRGRDCLAAAAHAHRGVQRPVSCGTWIPGGPPRRKIEIRIVFKKGLYYPQHPADLSQAALRLPAASRLGLPAPTRSLSAADVRLSSGYQSKDVRTQYTTLQGLWPCFWRGVPRHIPCSPGLRQQAAARSHIQLPLIER